MISHATCVLTRKMQFLAKKATIFALKLIVLQWILQFCRFQSLNVVFSLFSVYKFEFEKKIENLKIQDGGRYLLHYVAVVAMETNKAVSSSDYLKVQRTLILCARYLVNGMNGVKSRRDASD